MFIRYLMTGWDLGPTPTYQSHAHVRKFLVAIKMDSNARPKTLIIINNHWKNVRISTHPRRTFFYLQREIVLQQQS